MCNAEKAAAKAKAKPRSVVGEDVSRCKGPKINVTPKNIDFGDCSAGAVTQLQIEIENTGGAVLILTNIRFSDAVFSPADNTVKYGTTINPGGHVTMQIRFTPNADGQKNATLTIGSTDYSPGDNNIVNLTGRQVPPSIEIFRGDKILKVVPFATTDDAKKLDLKSPDPPPADDPGDSFPKKDFFDQTHMHKAKDDASIFRVRIKNLPSGTGDSIQATLKVLAQNEAPVEGRTVGFAYNGKATSGGGMTIELKKNDAVWESPYLRVATTMSNPFKSAIVHSLTPRYKDDVARDPIQGLQFGRKLKVLYGDVEKDFMMGGSPYAKVPVRFIWVSDTIPSQETFNKNADDKIAELNAYWAGHGLSFFLYNPQAIPPTDPVTRLNPPDRNLIVIGEHTGSNPVADHAFTVEIDLSITVGGTTYTKADNPEFTLTKDIPADSTPEQAAGYIKTAIEAFTPSDPLNGLRITADVFRFAEPRIPIAPPLGYLAGSPAMTLTPPIGNHGPIDIKLKRKEGEGPSVEKLEVVGLRAIRGALPDTDVDIYCPKVSKPFIDVKTNPVSAAHRHWIRTFGPPNGNEYVSVVIFPNADNVNHNYDWLCELGLCSLNDGSADWTARIHDNLRGQQSSTTPCSILNFDRWLSEECTRFLIFIPEKSYFEGFGNTLSHEFGHTLADCDHTISEPAWFYDWELMHTAGPIRQSANTMTRRAIQVVSVQKVADQWQSYYKDCPEGYGKVARDRIAAKAEAWLVTPPEPKPPGFPWTREGTDF